MAKISGREEAVRLLVLEWDREYPVPFHHLHTLRVLKAH